MINKGMASLLTTAVVLTAPQLPCYQALAGPIITGVKTIGKGTYSGGFLGTGQRSVLDVGGVNTIQLDYIIGAESRGVVLPVDEIIAGVRVNPVQTIDNQDPVNSHVFVAEELGTNSILSAGVKSGDSAYPALIFPDDRFLHGLLGFEAGKNVYRIRQQFLGPSGSVDSDNLGQHIIAGNAGFDNAHKGRTKNVPVERRAFEQRNRRGLIGSLFFGVGLMLAAAGCDGTAQNPNWARAPAYIEPLPYATSHQGKLPGLQFPLNVRIEKAQSRAAQYLLGAQRGDGSWGVGETAIAGHDNNHVQVPITVLGIQALEITQPSGGARAIERAVKSVYDKFKPESSYQSANTNNNHPYALTYGLSMLLDQLPHQKGPSRKLYEEAIQKLLKVSAVSSMHYAVMYMPKTTMPLPTPPASFQTALLAHELLRAQMFGFEIPHRLIEKDKDGKEILSSLDVLEEFLTVLEASRLPHGGFPYHMGRSDRQNDSELSTFARDPLIELVLYQGGRSDLGKLRGKVDAFMKYRGLLEKNLQTKRPTHGPYGIAKYYYLFGMYWTAQALGHLSDPDARVLAQQLIEDLLRRQREDGSWEDSLQYAGRSYGAAMGILTLETLSRIASRPAPAAMPGTILAPPDLSDVEAAIVAPTWNELFSAMIWSLLPAVAGAWLAAKFMLARLYRKGMVVVLALSALGAIGFGSLLLRLTPEMARVWIASVLMSAGTTGIALSLLGVVLFLAKDSLKFSRRITFSYLILCTGLGIALWEGLPWIELVVLAGNLWVWVSLPAMFFAYAAFALGRSWLASRVQLKNGT